MALHTPGPNEPHAGWIRAMTVFVVTNTLRDTLQCHSTHAYIRWYR